MAEAMHRQPFIDHIRELRSRLMWCVAVLLGGSILGYVFNDQVMRLFVQPLGKPLYYTSPGGGLSLVVQLCLSVGVVLATPVVMFHTLRFIAPALPGTSWRALVGLVLTSCLLMIVGVVFAYSVGLPAALVFLSDFSTDKVLPLISADTYGRFVAIYLAGFAVVFQLPLVLLIVNRATPLPPARLRGATRWVILLSFIVAAVVTPTPDPVNQTIVAGPIIALYVVSAVPIAIWNSHHKRSRTTLNAAPRTTPTLQPDRISLPLHVLPASGDRRSRRRIRTY